VTAEAAVFWCLSIILVGSALGVVLSKNLFHSVLWLALALVGTAGVFLLLEAEFLAAVQLLLYAGGVVTVAVFAIVVTERLVGERIAQTNRRIVGGAIVSLGVLALVVSTLTKTTLAVTGPVMPGDLTQLIGEGVLRRFVLPFELLALLMVAALLAAVYFARPEE
jgi:NADH-quinone oxidoreductase subunit J